jgi:hypothetical protein
MQAVAKAWQSLMHVDVPWAPKLSLGPIKLVHQVTQHHKKTCWAEHCLMLDVKSRAPFRRFSREMRLSWILYFRSVVHPGLVLYS